MCKLQCHLGRLKILSSKLKRNVCSIKVLILEKVKDNFVTVTHNVILRHDPHTKLKTTQNQKLRKKIIIALRLIRHEQSTTD